MDKKKVFYLSQLKITVIFAFDFIMRYNRTENEEFC
jgi:hypothetical protein